MAFSGTELQRLRSAAGKSRHELVLDLARAGEGVTERTLLRWEAGEGEPRANALAALAEALACDITDLYSPAA